MALTSDYPRRFETSNLTALTASAAIWQGAIVCAVRASGLAVGGVFSGATHRFAGIALNAAASGERVNLQPKGRVILDVAGSSAASVNAVVYASDDNTFNLAGSGVPIGRVSWVQENGQCVVDFDAAIEANALGVVTDAAGNTVLVGADGKYPLNQNFSPRIQSVHGLDLAEPLEHMSFPTPYGANTATAAGHYEWAYGTPVYCAKGFNGYKFWMVAAPYPTQAVDSAVSANPYKYENPCILVSNDGETWTVPDGLTNPIATSIGLADSGSYYADPYIAFNSDYTKLYVVWMWTNQSGTNKTSLLVSESSDGITWTAPVAIYHSTDIAVRIPNSPSLFWNGNGWTCICVNTKSSGGYVPEYMTTSSADPYSGWSAWSTSSWPHPLSRSWWHAHFIPLSGGGIIGMAVDNNAEGGTIYTLQSTDGGANFSVKPFSAWNSASAGGQWYRPSLCICSDGVNTSIKGYFGRMGTLAGKPWVICKADLGPSQKMLDATLFSLVASQSVQDDGTLAVWDSFNRADSALSPGTADGGGAWTVASGTLGISTNRLYNAGATGGSMGVLDTSLKSYEVSAKIETFAGEFYIVFNYLDSSNRYRFGYNSSGVCKFQKVSGGAVTTPDATPAITIAAGDTLGVRVQGKYITLLHNGRPIDTYKDDSIIQGTRVGFQFSGASTYVQQMMVKPL